MTVQTEVRLEKDFTLIDLNFTMTESAKKLMVRYFTYYFINGQFICWLLCIDSRGTFFKKKKKKPQIEINGSYKTVILNSRQVFCKCLNDPSSSHGVYDVYKKNMRLGNLPRKCPIAIGVGLNITFWFAWKIIIEYFSRSCTTSKD